MSEDKMKYNKELDDNINLILPELQMYYTNNPNLVTEVNLFRKNVLYVLNKLIEKDWVEEVYKHFGADEDDLSKADCLAKYIVAHIKHDMFPLTSAFTKLEICNSIAFSYLFFKSNKDLLR